MSDARSLFHLASSVLLVAAGCGLFAGCVLNSEVGGGTAGDGGAAGGGSAGAAGSSSGGTGGAGGTGGGASGVPQVLATAQGMNPWALAVDDSDVYFTDAQGPNGKVARVSKNGGPLAVLAIGQELPSAITVDATDVYFMDSYHVMKVAKAGGVVTAMADAENATYSSVVVDDDQIYWTNYTMPGSVKRMPKAGGAPIHVADDSYPAGIVLAGGNMYWAGLESYEIHGAPTAGGPAFLVAGGQPAPRWGIAASADHLYWITEGTFPMEVWGVPLDASTPPAQVGISPVDSSSQVTLVVDDNYLYFPVYFCKIARIPVGGGAAIVTDVDPALGCPSFITADADNLYYTSSVGITKYPKSAL